MNRVFFAMFLSSALLLAACQPEADTFGPSPADDLEIVQSEVMETAPPPTYAFGGLPDFFDCVREEGAMLIASHRGGPAPGYPENALETLQHATAQGIVIHEIDVAESRDGVLFLMHDNSLGRTTTGSGQVADTDWDDIARLRLVDNQGRTTGFNPPKLSDILLWARETGAIVELDKKRTTSFRNIISHVRAAGAEDHVVLISYNDQQAIEIARLAPDLMMTASVNSRDHQRDLEAAGVNMDHVIAWTGTNYPNDRAWAALGRRGIESAFGTLGRAGERLDDEYIADGDLSEYQDLANGGVSLLASDEAYRVAAALQADDHAIKACGA